MKNPRYRNSQPPPQPPQCSEVLASPPPSLHPKGDNSLKETVMVAALSICCILGDWVHLIRLCFNFKIWSSILDNWVYLIRLCFNFKIWSSILDNWVYLIRLYFKFEMWCRKYSKTYPSLKEKLYRFSLFKESFEEDGSMPNFYGDRTEDELEILLPLGSYDDSDSEEEFIESLEKRAGNTYRVYEENDQVLVHCSGPNTFRDSDIEEEKIFDSLRRNPGFTYQVCKENDNVWVRCSGNVADQTSNESNPQ